PNFNLLPPTKWKTRSAGGIAALVDETSSVHLSTFPLFLPSVPPQPTPASELELGDPDFYKIGYVRSMRAYGIEFREGPNGFGVPLKTLSLFAVPG
ncbi:plastid transcriptionally active 14, partial [Striga hermonthica]